MRKKLIAGNWKMNKSPSEAHSFVSTIRENTFENEVVFLVPFVSIPSAIDATQGSLIKIGAQNMHFEDSGAFTGEISAKMLKDLGVEYVIIGHSERRAYFGETDETVNKKIKKALEHGLTPIVCVGETLNQREQGITFDLLRMQTKIALLDIPSDSAKNIVIAYEPIWAIGTGVTATSAQAQEACLAIRNTLSELYDGVADSIRILYGGSVTSDNSKELFDMPDIDGGLVGGASLKEDFVNICK